MVDLLDVIKIAAEEEKDENETIAATQEQRANLVRYMKRAYAAGSGAQKKEPSPEDVLAKLVGALREAETMRATVIQICLLKVISYQ